MSKVPIIVDLWAPWCAPCRAMEPALKQVSAEFAGKVRVLKINADDSQDVLNHLGVMGIPTVVAYAGGKEVMRRSGIQPADALRSLFEAAFAGKKPVVIPPTPIGRIVRVIAGLGAVVAGWYLDRSIVLFVVGGILIFSAFYDRCPVYRAVATRAKTIFRKTVE